MPDTPHIAVNWPSAIVSEQLQQEEPITSALCLALARAVQSMPSALSGAPPVTMKHADELGLLVESIREITGWLAPEREPLSEDEIKRAKIEDMEWCLRSGGSSLRAAEVGDISESVHRRKRGRPKAAMRRLAVRFLDGQSRDKKLSYVQFMNRNCQCKGRTHAVCAGALRQQVRALKVTLKRYGIPCPQWSRDEAQGIPRVKL